MTRSPSLSVLNCFSCVGAVTTTAVSLKDAAAFMRRRLLLLVPAFAALAFVSHPSALKHMLVSP